MKIFGRRWGPTSLLTGIQLDHTISGKRGKQGVSSNGWHGRHRPCELFDGAFGLRVSTDIPYFGMRILTAFHPIDA